MDKYLLKGIEKISKQLDLEFGYTVANYNFEYGLPLENAIKNFFTPYFPKRYHFGSGYLVDAIGQLSNQTDWIIYDGIHFSPLMSKSYIEDGLEFYPFDSMYACVEVKRTLNADSLKKAIKQLTKTRSLQRSKADASYIHPLLSYKAMFPVDVSDIFTNHLITTIYAYSQNETLPDDAAELCKYFTDNFDFHEIPDLVAIHGKYLIFKTNRIESKEKGASFSFSIKFDEANSLSCVNSAEMTSGYFYAFLLNMLQNTFLSAVDYTNALNIIATGIAINSRKVI